MYYFKVPVFTKLSRIQNIVVVTFQSIVLIISIAISLYRGCSYESTDFINGCSEFSILPGNTLVTNESYSIWQFINAKKYTSELLTEISTMEYYNIFNTTLNGYVLIKGNIVLFNYKYHNYDALFKEFILPVYYDNFNYYFKDIVDMNNDIYNVGIKDGFLELMFYNNCSENKSLYENNQGCLLNNNTLNNINNFLISYFSELFIVPYNCHNCYKNGIKTTDEAITVLSKCISIFLMFNSFFIIIYIFILSKISDIDIGYINNVINHDIKQNIIKYKEDDCNYIEEIIKN